MKIKQICLFLTFLLKETHSLPTIQPNLPSPTNTLATGHRGLVVTAQFEKDFESYLWINTFADNNNVPQFYVVGAGCVPRESINENITCVENNGVITSNLTYLQPLTTNLDLSVRSGFLNEGDISELRIVISLPLITVQDCNETLKDNVTVQFTSAGYNDVGNFTCSNDGRLFYSNGSQPTSNQTTCQYNAEWSGQDDLQCWRAPNPVITTMNGNFTGIEGNNFTVTCEYNDVIPIGTNTTFYLDDNEVGRQQERSFTFTLRVEYNKKEVSCQAVTPYTKIFTKSGRSPDYSIDVQYAPFQNNPTSCSWVFGQKESCDVTFMSNPPAKLLALIKNSSGMVLEGGSLENDGTSQIFMFVKDNATMDDNGTYTLYLQSSIAPYNHTIMFDVIVEKYSSTGPTSNTLAIALGVVGAVLVILLIVLVLFCYKRRNSSRTSKDQPLTHRNGAFEASTQGNVESPSSAFSGVGRNNGTGTSEKEERVNPLYASSGQPAGVETAYAEVKKEKKNKGTSEKEEKVNPLYVSSEPPIIESAYEMIDKKEKKNKGSSEKEEKINPLYVSSDQSNSANNAYAEVDKKKKRSKTSGKTANNNAAGTSGSKDVIEEAYSEVKHANKGLEVDGNQEVNQHPTYAEVNKPKKKKKTAPTQRSPESGGNPDAHNGVVVHGGSSKVDQIGDSSS